MINGTFQLFNTEDESVTFHMYGKDIHPFSKFTLACQWHSGFMLTPQSKLLMESILDRLTVQSGIPLLLCPLVPNEPGNTHFRGQVMKQEFKIINKHLGSAKFHLIGSYFIPADAFYLAVDWYYADHLTPDSKADMERIIENHNDILFLKTINERSSRRKQQIMPGFFGQESGIHKWETAPV